LTALIAEDLEFSYGNGGFRLHVPRWRVEAGERLALYGPSGCGKSTLLALIAGTLSASSGSLRVAGREVVGLPEAARRAWRLRHLGFVFQDHPLVEHLTAEENVLLPYLIGGLRLDGQARTRGRGLLEELGLADKLRRLPQRLSQGERQRVGLARALVTLPDLLLADEPTSGLDPARARQVVDLLLATSAARGVTLLVVSHDLAVVERLDARVDVSAWAPTGPERVSGRE